MSEAKHVVEKKIIFPRTMEDIGVWELQLPPESSPAIILSNPVLISPNGMTASIKGSILCFVKNSTSPLESSSVLMTG